MKSEKIRRAIGGIDDDLIEAAQQVPVVPKSSAFKKWGAAAAALVILIGAAFLLRGIFTKNELSAMSDPAAAQSSETGENLNTGASSGESSPIPASSQPQFDSENVVWATETLYAENEGLHEWNGKHYVTYRLSTALDNALESDVFAIRIRPHPDTDYVFEGRTLGDYYLEMGNEQDLPEKLQQLLKEGEDLKYGDKLWQEGNAEGIKWYKSLYDERVEFYGEELLSKYIVNGEFLSEQLEADIETALEADSATRAWERARDAWRQELCEAIRGVFPTELCSYEPYGIIAYFTKEDFAAFERPDDPDFAEWGYDLALAWGDDDEAVIAIDANLEAQYGSDE